MKSSNTKASKSHLGQNDDNDTEWMLSTHSILYVHQELSLQMR